MVLTSSRLAHCIATTAVVPLRAHRLPVLEEASRRATMTKRRPPVARPAHAFAPATTTTSARSRRPTATGSPRCRSSMCSPAAASSSPKRASASTSSKACCRAAVASVAKASTAARSGVYPAKTVRRINAVKQLMIDGYTIEEIQGQFLLYTDLVEGVAENLTELWRGSAPRRRPSSTPAIAASSRSNSPTPAATATAGRAPR